jgi:hypothetical protein
MAQKAELMASSLPASAASKLGFDPLTAFAAAGSGQSSATSLTANAANVSSGSGGVVLASNEQTYLIVNSSGSNVSVYPPSGGAFNGGTVNAAFTLTNGKSMMAIPVGDGNFFANLSA